MRTDLNIPTQAREGNPTGSGLGLYISHGIIEAHGGTLWAENVLGQGSVFNCRLPAHRRSSNSQMAASVT